MARTRGYDRPETSLDAAMREPSIRAPDVVVLDHVDPPEPPRGDVADPKQDLWLSTVDGRYSSPIIPVRVGHAGEVFSVHKSILIKSEYFRRALEGGFREAGNQAIELPEENPDIFSFVVAWLYEEKFVPIKSMSLALVAGPDKGKGKEGVNEESQPNSLDSGSESTHGSIDGYDAARDRRRRRRRSQRSFDIGRRKQPGRHRPSCNCAACVSLLLGPPCWSCGASRNAPDPRRHMHDINGPPGPVMYQGPPRAPGQRRRDNRPPYNRAREPIMPPLIPPNLDEDGDQDRNRMTPEDMRTWSLTYDLSIDVYVCADRYLMQDFKAAIAVYIINSFETAGVEAAVPAVLYSCHTLAKNVSRNDPILKKVLSRVGFLQTRLDKNFAEETENFFTVNPDLARLIMREMVERLEEDTTGDTLPSMDVAPTFRPLEDFTMQGRMRRQGREYGGEGW